MSNIGGNLTSVIAQRLLNDRYPRQPKLQILIYPWVQLADSSLPSMCHYEIADLHPSKLVSWYLGIRDYEKFRQVLSNYSYVALLQSEEKAHISSCLDVQRIPNQYKSTQAYYDKYVSSDLRKKLLEQNDDVKQDDTHVLKCDAKLAEAMRRMFSAEVSPLFAKQADLVGQPPVYMIVLEWDPLKDQDLLYAERLKEAGVPTHVAFYENAFHGSALLTSALEIARQMQADLVNYIKANI